MKKIVVVEDDRNMCTELVQLLKNSGYEAESLKDFEHAEEALLASHSDLILLDINIPYINGEMLLQNLRKKSDVPVIMLTSRNNEVDEVLSMSYGADDYITKPYNPTILLLRISNVLKRIQSKEDSKYRDLEINMQNGTIKKDDVEIILTKNEMIIFGYLLQHQNKIVTRDELMTTLWNNDEYINDNALTVNISRLRTKLKDVGCEDAIETRKGIGYILL